MTKFKEKNFGNYNIGKNFVGNLIKDPTKAAALGLSGTALAVSMHRNRQLERQGREQKKLGQQQLKAMQELTRTLGTVNTSMQNFKMPPPSQYYQQKQPEKKGFFRRFFSIQEGSYKGGKRKPVKSSVLKGATIGAGAGAVGGAILGAGAGATIGAISGAGAGALFVWLSNVADESLFNSGCSRNANSYNLIQVIEAAYSNDDPDSEEISLTDKESGISTRSTFNKKAISPKGLVYDIDGDPRKYIISALYKGNTLVMYLNDPDTQEMRKLNEVLDNYCYKFKNADYSSEQVKKNIYIVELFVVEGAEEDIIMSLINSGFKINILTGNRFGINNR